PHRAGIVEGEHDFQIVTRFISGGEYGDLPRPAEDEREEETDIGGRRPLRADIIDPGVDLELGNDVHQRRVAADVDAQELVENLFPVHALVIDPRCGENGGVDGVLKL